MTTTAANRSDRSQKDPTPARQPSTWRRYERYWLPIGTVVIILVVWEILGRMGLWNPLFFSSPSEIWGGFTSLTEGPLWSDLRVSGIEFAIGMAIALGLGVPIGLLLGSNRRLNHAFDPIINALYSTPILVLTPLLVIWFGLGMGSKIANVAILAIFPVIINMIEGVRTVDPVLLRAARSFGASGLSIYKDVTFPSVIPFFITGVRLAIGKGMIAVVVGEYIAATEGIGYRIRADAEVFNTSRYLAAVMIMVVISVVMMGLLKVVEKKLAPWRDTTIA
ncbi:nitrate ABC transporter permease [Rhodococcus opacus PD630]|uniref:ABC transporter permease n=1 Tax=Rhodococcus TaxID=1827 RepID=UPI00029CD1D0|nr:MULTISPECIES: ABC transporter permease [Rhodococcus]KXF48699.1 ABC transporter permease [Rhodococcus sp. SC4]RZK74900.1 MAG: ABC transporter permease [Rhodococcus sp. (in: high G+C Gram-positive bacteria)]AHK34234.1 Taurine transport system permease protein tauC [Rhodococcus opacus PD630]EHI39852.1 nitrate ABC transporter permease [Rhodococcus opacus PD630]KXX61906.1 ABC transporter permease [Rhodococcus sp. LB1]